MRLFRALRWSATSLGAACAGALAAGLVEAIDADGVLDAVTTLGFIAMLAVPILFVLSMVARGLWAAWRPRETLAPFVEDDGRAPALAAWIVVGLVGTAVVAGSLFVATRLIASHGAFAALSVGTIDGIVAPVIATLAVIAALPAARGLTRAFRRVPGLRPRNVFAAAAILVVGGLAGVWHFVVAPRLGPLDLVGLWSPAIAVAVAIAAHRFRFAIATAVPVAASIGVAIYARFAQPMLVLDIWADRPFAGLAVEHVFDLDTIRGSVLFTAFAPSAAPNAAHPDIILITIDTVRADHTPPYGGGAEMPAFTSLAARGATFDWAYSPSNVTRRSIPSMVIGLAPGRIKGRVVGWSLRVDPRYVLLAERMRAAGYDTAGFMCCEGFWGASAHTGLSRGLDHLEIDPIGTALAGKARTWLERRQSKKPLFLWMHILEPHGWTQQSAEPRNDAERNRFYDQSLARADKMLAEVLVPLAQKPPIVIVTADHGEALGEHGQPFHSTDLFNSQIHVPMVIAGPGIANRRVAETVSSIDLVPTVLDLAGFVPPRGPDIDGVSFADLARGTRTGIRRAGSAYAEMIKDRSNPGGLVAIVDGNWKLIDTDGKLALYDLQTDPNELRDRSGDAPEALARLRGLLAQRKARMAQSPFP